MKQSSRRPIWIKWDARCETIHIISLPYTLLFFHTVHTYLIYLPCLCCKVYSCFSVLLNYSLGWFRSRCLKTGQFQQFNTCIGNHLPAQLKVYVLYKWSVPLYLIVNVVDSFVSSVTLLSPSWTPCTKQVGQNLTLFYMYLPANSPFDLNLSLHQAVTLQMGIYALLRWR